MGDYTEEQLSPGEFYIMPEWADFTGEHEFKGEDLIGPFPNQMEAIEWYCNNLPPEITDNITDIYEPRKPEGALTTDER